MTQAALLVPQELPSAVGAPDLRVQGRITQVEVPLPFGAATLRLRRMAGRWLATATGPHGDVEIGADRSPYLAAGMALERWQPDLVQVMTAVGHLVRVGR